MTLLDLDYPDFNPEPSDFDLGLGEIDGRDWDYQPEPIDWDFTPEPLTPAREEIEL